MTTFFSGGLGEFFAAKPQKTLPCFPQKGTVIASEVEQSHLFSDNYKFINKINHLRNLN